MSLFTQNPAVSMNKNIQRHILCFNPPPLSCLNVLINKNTLFLCITSIFERSSLTRYSSVLLFLYRSPLVVLFLLSPPTTVSVCHLDSSHTISLLCLSFYEPLEASLCLRCSLSRSLTPRFHFFFPTRFVSIPGWIICKRK